MSTIGKNRNIVRQKDYNPELDFWKLLFAIAVFLYHSHNFEATSGASLFAHGYLAVEFFFMVSGCLITPRGGGIESTHRYLRKRVKRIYPQYLAAFTISFFGRQLIIQAGKLEVFRNFVMAWPEALVLQMYGLPKLRLYNDPTWYISSMLIGIALLWPILQRWPKSFPKIGAPILCITGYAIVAQLSKTGKIQVTTAWDPIGGIFYLGNIRAIAGLCAGIFCRECCDRIKSMGVRTTALGKCILVWSQLLLAGLLVAIMNFRNGLGLNYKYDYAALLLIFLLVLIICSELTGIKELIKMPALFKRMGTFSFYLYLNHRIVIYWLVNGNRQWGYRHYMFWYVIGTALTMGLCWIIVKLGERLKQRYGTRIYKLLFQ